LGVTGAAGLVAAGAAGFGGGGETSVAAGTWSGSFGGSGAMILAWHDGHSIFLPEMELSTLKFWLQLGQLNLNSIM
jgi:hypothetical protein